MTVHRYPPAAVVADLVRAGLGAVLAAAPLVFLPLARWLTGLLVIMFALFVLYAAAGVGRGLARIEADRDGVRLAGLWRQRTVAWERLRRLRLTYHSTWANRGDGWMTLSLTADDRIDFEFPDRRFRRDRPPGGDGGRAPAPSVRCGDTVQPARTRRRPPRHRGGRAMTDLLAVERLVVGFTGQGGTVRAVDDLSFRVRKGSAVAIVGESGSGKSVTAQTILGILPRNGRILSGSIRLAAPGDAGTIDLTALPPESDAYLAIRGKRVAMIFQEPMTSLSPLHTIGDQVSEALFLHTAIGRSDGKQRTLDMLRLVGFDNPPRAFDTYPFELSGGLRQRAMIAMALICRPALLIADEPSTALDVTIQAQILKLIGELRRELGMAVLLITHDLGVVANVAEEVVVMYNGRAVESGGIDDIFRRPQHPYLKGLLGAVPHFDMRPGERLKPLREINRFEGHLLKAAAPGAAAGDGEASGPLLEVVDLVKTFSSRKGRGMFGSGPASRVTAVDRVGFSVHRGECVGLVGESGCGKTTVSKMILRGVEPDSGSVLYHDGRTVDLLALERRAMFSYRRKIQYIFQDPHSSLNPRMTVYDILTEPLIVHGVGDSRYRRQLVAELMQRVGLDPRFLRRHPHSFSGGQRQRIGIARALALRPDLIICDEPVSALDVSVQAQILNLLKALQADLGLTYLFISHNLAVVDYMADRILVMCAGRIVEEAPREILFRRPAHPYTRALLAAVPFPDPDRQLDFSRLMDGRASESGRLAPTIRRRGRRRDRHDRSRPGPPGAGAGGAPGDEGRRRVMSGRLCVLVTAFVLAAAAAAADYIETPSLAANVAEGRLPPVAARLPRVPRIIDAAAFGGSNGVHGGTLRLLMSQPKDTRMMVVYGYARLVGYTTDWHLAPDLLAAVEVDEGRDLYL